MTEKKEFTNEDQERLTVLKDQTGYHHLDALAKLLDQMLPNQINYVLLSFGTLVMIDKDQ